MRAIQLTSYVPSPSHLSVTTLPTPRPKDDEYLIAIHAAATNFFDLLQIRGKYQDQPPFPWIGGREFAGEVLETPKEKSSTASSRSFQIGDRVFGAAQGAYSTHICCKASDLRPIPAGWTFRDAAGLMVTAPTAYAALAQRARARRGETVLVHAAAGGVGLAAVQVAKALGCRVIGTVGGDAISSRKARIVKAFGADEVVDYRQQNWEQTVKKSTKDGRGVDVVFDPVGKINQSLSCAAWDARIVVVGFAAGQIEKVAMNRVLLKNVSIVGLFWGMYAVQEPETVAEVWKGLFRMIDDKKFRTTVFTDEEFHGLESVGQALEMLQRRETWGKVVVTVPGPQEGTSKL